MRSQPVSKETTISARTSPARHWFSLAIIFSTFLILAACRPPQDAQPITVPVIPTLLPATAGEAAAATLTPTGTLATSLPFSPAGSGQSLPVVTLDPTGNPGAIEYGGCIYNVDFIEDVTIADKEVMEPDIGFTKVWRVENSGTCTWDSGFQLVHVSGETFGSYPVLPVTITDPGGRVDLWADMVAPGKPGTYTGIWQLQTPDGYPFGAELVVRIVIPGPPPTSRPIPPAAAPVNTPIPAADTVSYDHPDLYHQSGDPSYLYNVGDNARRIFLTGQQKGSRVNIFSKVGDSNTYSWYFLNPIGEGMARWGGYDTLRPTAEFFAVDNARAGNSLKNYSLAAFGGWKASDLMNPAQADPLCDGASPLVCEYREVRPSIAIIMIGTNESDLGGFPVYLERIVQTSIDMGVLPVLSTVPSAYNFDVRAINAIIFTTAYRYDIPLIDFYAALDGMPNRGLAEDDIHPSWPEDENTADFTGSRVSEYGFTKRNITTLEMLKILRERVLLP